MRIRRFIDGLNNGLNFVMTREIASSARFDEVIDIVRRLEQVHSQEREEMDAKRPRGSGGFSGVSSGGKSHHSRGRSYRPAQMARPVHCGASASHGSYSAHPGQSSLRALPVQSLSRAPSAQGSSVPGPSSSYSGSWGPIQYLPPLTDRSCYVCGEFVHMRRYCPHFLGGPVQQRGPIMTFAPVTSPPAQPARGRPIREGRSCGDQARCSAFPARPEAVASYAVIKGIVSVCHRDTSILFNPGSTYSYVLSYFSRYLDMPHESFVSLVHVSTPVGNSIIVDRVYRSCVVIIGGLDTRVDILFLSMVNFDVILGMDWLSPCHTILDFHTMTVTLAMPGLPRIEWRSSLDYVPSRVISYLKAQRMVVKGCLVYLAFMRDVGANTPPIDSVPVVRDFLDVFPADLPGMPPDRDIDFGIDLVSGT
ncbi:uncharacterized protein [Nicotiana tomentosiformis]|uniref:uncharacterized protein n=1 Tax=Nicotiana tomentosiformis TaxID=4098 RepID=UPI00388C934A